MGQTPINIHIILLRYSSRLVHNQNLALGRERQRRRENGVAYPYMEQHVHVLKLNPSIIY